ncbi:MAG: nicotinate phosphoribosyltransferase, partial [Bellilinea sp.]
MSIFDQKRLTNATFKLDIERMRKGWYTDKYYMLEVLAQSNYAYHGNDHRLPLGIDPTQIDAGDLEVEMQWFTRRQGKTLVVGVDKALTMLRHCTGYFEGDTFVDTADRQQVRAVQDGAMVHSDGNPLHVNPVIRVRGRYRDFAILETPTLGIL